MNVIVDGPYGGYDDEAHRIRCLKAMEDEREEDLEEERHLAIQRLAREEWNPLIRDVDSFLKYSGITFETIAGFPNYVPQRHVHYWTDAVLENSIDIRSTAQQSFDDLGIPTVPCMAPSKQYFFLQNGASAEHCEDLAVEDADIYDAPQVRKNPPGFPHLVGAMTLPWLSFNEYPVVEQPISSNTPGDYCTGMFQDGILVGTGSTVAAPSTTYRSMVIEVETTSEVVDEVETPASHQPDTADMEPTNVNDLGALLTTPVDSAWDSCESTSPSEVEFEEEKPRVTVSFPHTASRPAHLKAYKNQTDAILDIQLMCGREHSDYCIYDPKSNNIHLRLKDDVSPLDIIAEIENQGHELQWISIKRNRGEKDGQEQDFDQGFEDFVFYDQDSENTTAENETSDSDLIALDDNRSLSYLEPFPEDQADAPTETFGGSPIEIMEPFPKFEEHSSSQGISGLPAETSQVESENNQSIITAREVHSSESGRCHSEGAVVDSALGMRYPGSHLCYNWLSEKVLEKATDKSLSSCDSSITLCTENNVELPTTLNGGPSQNSTAHPADPVTEDDSLDTALSKSNAKAKDIHGTGHQLGNTSSNNTKTSSPPALRSTPSEISLPSGFRFSKYGDVIRQTTLEIVIPKLVKSRLLKNEKDSNQHYDPSSTRHGQDSLPLHAVIRPFFESYGSLGKGKGRLPKSEESGSSSETAQGANSSGKGKGKDSGGNGSPATSLVRQCDAVFDKKNYACPDRPALTKANLGVTSQSSDTNDTDDSSLYRR